MKKPIVLLIMFALLGSIAGAVFASQAVRGIREAARSLAGDLERELVEAGIASVAVFPFEDLDKRPIPFGRQMALAVQSALSDSNAPFAVLESEKVDEVLKELGLSGSGLFDEDVMVQIGHLLPAQTMLFGIVDTTADPLSVNARIVSVETREILSTAYASIDRDQVAGKRLRPARKGHRGGAEESSATLPVVQGVDFSVSHLFRNLDQRGATVILQIENLLEEEISLAFAQAGFGKCEVSLISDDQRHYRLVDEDTTKSRSETEIGAGGLECAKKDDPRGAYSMLAAGQRIELPLTFRAKVKEEMTPGPLTLEGKLVRFTRQGRVDIPILISGIDSIEP
jgi:hypothetical protein